MNTPSDDIPMPNENKVSKKTKNRKTRNRTPLSCSVCRSRKVKCDKNKPHCNSCVNTGYKHLCQYLSPEWSKDGYNQIFQEKEITDLKDKIKYLEKMLAGYQNKEQPIKIQQDDLSFLSNITSKQNNAKKYYYDEITVSKRFESLHINPKTNLFTYLGSTHYLSILKGDPYLKLLWEHVFKIREKLLEYQVYQRNISMKKQMKKAVKNTQEMKCPVSHTKMMQEAPTGKCPVNHMDIMQNSNIKKCPVAHDSLPDDPTQMKCPISHETFTEKPQGKYPVAHSVATSTETSPKPGAGRCDRKRVG